MVARSTSKAETIVFWYFFFTPSPLRFGGPPLTIFSKNVDFCLWGKQCIVLPKWTFFRVLAHCTMQVTKTSIIWTYAYATKIYFSLAKLFNCVKECKINIFYTEMLVRKVVMRSVFLTTETIYKSTFRVKFQYRM